MDQKEILVTHFYRRPPDPTLWIHTSFITRKRGSNQRFWGLSNDVVDPRKIKADVDDRGLKELDVDIPIHEGETVWIAPDQSVFVADARNPLAPSRRYITQDKIPNPFDTIEKTILKKIAAGAYPAKDKVTQSFCSPAQWKTLLAILVKLLNNGELNEKNFFTVGYLFLILEARYAEFNRELNGYRFNGYYMTVSQGHLGFLNNKDLFYEWEIAIDTDSLESYFPEPEEEDFVLPDFSKLSMS